MRSFSSIRLSLVLLLASLLCQAPAAVASEPRGTLSPVCSTTKISPELETKLGSMGNSQGVRVLVRVKDQGLNTPAAEGRQARKVARLQRLKEITRHNQQNVLQRMEDRAAWHLVKSDGASRAPKPQWALRVKQAKKLLEAESFWVSDCFAVTVTPTQLQELADDPDVLEISENLTLSVPPVSPTDSDFENGPGNFWNLAAIGAEELRGTGPDGTGVRIGHLDTGIDAAHPDLAGKVAAWAEFDSAGKKLSTQPHESHVRGHGTHTASIMVGTTTGVAPGASLLSALVLPGGYGTLEQVLAGIQWVLDPDGNPQTDDGAHIVNMSLGTPGNSIVLREAVANMAALGVLPVCSIGNGGYPSTYSPGNTPEALSVGAVDQDDNVPGFSSGGEVCWESVCLTKPDLSAPGNAVTGAKPGEGYQSMTGTSMASPHVAAAAALLLQHHPSLKLEDLKSFLLNSSLDLGDPGRDTRYGEGRLDIAASLSFLDRYPQRMGAPDIVLETKDSRFSLPIYRYHVFFSGGSGSSGITENSTVTLYASSSQSQLKALGVGDVDGDGYVDLIIRETTPVDPLNYRVDVNVYPATSVAGFSKAYKTIYSCLSPSPFEMVGLADVNGDGKTDVVLSEREKLATGERHYISILLSTGTGTYQKSPLSQERLSFFVNESSTLELALGDVNGDGKADLISGVGVKNSYNYYPVYYNLNLSDGKKFLKTAYSAGYVSPSSAAVLPTYLCMADVDGDGRDDFILQGKESGSQLPKTTIYVMRSNGSTRLLPTEIWASLNNGNGESTCPITASDINGDGAADLIVGSLDANGSYTSFTAWISTPQHKFVRSSASWINLDSDLSARNPRVAGIGDVGLGDWRQ